MEFKVGDRVRVVRAFPGVKSDDDGKTGMFVAYIGGPFPYRVHLDRPETYCLRNAYDCRACDVFYEIEPYDEMRESLQTAFDRRS